MTETKKTPPPKKKPTKNKTKPALTLYTGKMLNFTNCKTIFNCNQWEIVINKRVVGILVT